MSFELAISTPKRPLGLTAAWQAAFQQHGFDVEIYPPFSVEAWAGGFLPFRVASAPHDLVGLVLDGPALAGFEISFSREGAHLRTASGRSTIDFALQCIGGATLAMLCEGHYIDDQNSVVVTGREALDAAIAETKAFVASADSSEKVAEPFPGWDALG